MDEEMNFFATSNWLESLIKSRQYLTGSPLLAKLDEIIEKEMELALKGADKALTELNKTKDNVRTIK